MNPINGDLGEYHSLPNARELEPESSESLVTLAITEVLGVVRDNKPESIRNLAVFSNQEDQSFTAEQINSILRSVKKELGDAAPQTVYRELAHALKYHIAESSPKDIEDDQIRFEWVKALLSGTPDLGKPELRQEFAIYIAENIQEMGITNQYHLFEIAKLVATYCPDAIEKHINNFGITDKDRLFEIAKFLITDNGSISLEVIANAGISDPEQIFELVKLAAAHPGLFSVQFIKNIEISNPDHCLEIVKVLAVHHPLVVPSAIQVFKIQDQDQIFEIAKIAAAHSGERVSRSIKDYQITDRERLFTVAKIAAAHNGEGVSENIQNYFPLDEEAKLEILALAVKQNVAALEYIENYEFKNADTNPILNALREMLGAKSLDDGLEKAREGASQKGFDIKPITDAIRSETNQEAQEQQLVWLAFLMLRLALTDGTIIHDLDSSYSLLKTIMEVRQPELRYELTNAFAKAANNPDIGARFKNLQGSKADQCILANLFLADLESQGVDPTIIQQWIVCLKQPNYSDKVKMNQILSALNSIAKDTNLDVRDKEDVLKRLIEDPKSIHKKAIIVQAIFEFGSSARLISPASYEDILKKLFNENVPIGQVEHFGDKWETHIVQGFRQMQLLAVFAGKLSSQSDSQQLLEVYGTFIRSVLEGDFKAVRYQTENNPHLDQVSKKVDLDAWKVNLEKPLSPSDETAGESAKTDYKQILRDKILVDKHLNPDDFPFIVRVLNGEDAKVVNQDLGKALRGAKDKTDLQIQGYLIKMAEGKDVEKAVSSLIQLMGKKTGVDEFKHDLEGFARLLSQLQKPIKQEEFTIVNTDDPCDLFLCGTEVEGSCQRVDGDANLNKCLLGYCMNGSNRLIAIKDANGKIVARTMLRLLWSEENQTPVLFQERVYPAIPRPGHKEALLEAAKETAERLKLTLTGLEGDIAYQGTILSLGGPAPYEYSDAAGGVKPRGIYEITKAKVVSA